MHVALVQEAMNFFSEHQLTLKCLFLFRNPVPRWRDSHFGGLYLLCMVALKLQCDLSKDYWMGFEGERLVSAICVSGYCCQNSGDCNYINDLDTEGVLCAKYRSTDSMLCSECDDGLSGTVLFQLFQFRLHFHHFDCVPWGGATESVNSAQCVDCEGKNYLTFLALPGLMALLMSTFILLTNTDKVVDAEEERRKLEKQDSFMNNIRHESNKHMVASLAKVTV